MDLINIALTSVHALGIGAFIFYLVRRHLDQNDAKISRKRETQAALRLLATYARITFDLMDYSNDDALAEKIKTGGDNYMPLTILAKGDKLTFDEIHNITQHFHLTGKDDTEQDALQSAMLGYFSAQECLSAIVETANSDFARTLSNERKTALWDLLVKEKKRLAETAEKLDKLISTQSKR